MSKHTHTHTHLFQCKPLRSVLNKPSTSIDFIAIFAILFCSYNRITRFLCSSSHQVIQSLLRLSSRSRFAWLSPSHGVGPTFSSWERLEPWRNYGTTLGSRIGRASIHQFSERFIYGFHMLWRTNSSKSWPLECLKPVVSKPVDWKGLEPSMRPSKYQAKALSYFCWGLCL